MKTLVAGIMLVALPALAPAADIAAKVLVAVGDVKITRGGTELPAPTGTNVEVGDTIRLGERSNAQVRFTDESIMALRQNSVLVVSEYRFDRAAPESGSMLFNLLAGGLRTVTGALARARPSGYRMTTPTATIGIRGTHYTLVQCDNNCRGATGALAPNGTYGSVSDGRIGVSNSSGETVFGKDQYFHVASSDQPAQRLLAPPAFLRDRLEGQQRSPNRQGAQPGAAPAQTAQQGQQGGGSGQDQAVASGTGSDGRVSTNSTPLVTQTVIQTNVFLPTENLNSQGLSAATQVGNSGNIFLFGVGTGTDNLGNTGSISARTGISFAYQRVGIIAFGSVGGVEYNFATPFAAIPLQAGSGGATFSASFQRADYPLNSGAFKCDPCGSSNFLDSLTFDGTFSGGTLSLTASATSNATGRTLNVVDTLSTVTPTTGKAAAYIVPNSPGTGAGAGAGASALFDLAVDASGRLTSFLTVPGVGKGTVGSATNTLVGTVSGVAGNLAYGAWTGSGAQIRDFNYTAYTSPGGFSLPWITGDVTSAVSPTLGSSVNYVPAGGTANNGTASFVGGLINVNFTNQNLTVQNLQVSRSSGELYTANGQGFFSPTSARFSAGFTSATCSGGSGCTGTIRGGFAGFFAGPNAESIGLSYTVGNGAVGVSGVQAFKR